MAELTPPAGYQNYNIIIVPSLSEAQLALYTPGYSEIILVEETLELVVGDGSTVGGNYRVGAGGAAGGNSWYILHVEGASPTTDVIPTAANSQLTLDGLYGFSFITDTVAKKLIGALPTPGPVGEGLLSTGAAWVSGPSGGTVFGRSLPVSAEEGDYTTNQVVAVAGYNYLDAPVITPPTDGQVLTRSTAAGGYVGGAGGTGGAGVSSTFDLLATPTFDITAPPSFAYYNGVRVVSFDATTSQIMYGTWIWPAGSSFTIKIQVSMLTAVTGTIGFGFQMMKTTPGAAVSIKTDSYATENLGSATVSTTSQGLVEVTIAVTNLDGAVAGDNVRWKLRRNTSVGGNAAGFAEVWAARFIPTV